MPHPKQIRQFPWTQPRDRAARPLVQRALDQLSFLLLKGENAVLDGLGNKDAMHDDGFRLTDAVGAVNGLFFDVGVPEGVENDDYKMSLLALQENVGYQEALPWLAAVRFRPEFPAFRLTSMTRHSGRSLKSMTASLRSFGFMLPS